LVASSDVLLIFDLSDSGLTSSSDTLKYRLVLLTWASAMD